MTRPMVPVTAIILTHNESANIGRCLERLSRAQEVILVDSGSEDGTLERARQFRSDLRVLEHPFQDFADQRNWALDHAEPACEWVLFVDADEFCNDPLMDEIAGLVASPGDQVGAFVAGRNYFLGRWLKYTTFFPSYQLRLLRVGQVRFRKEGHGQREVTEGALCYLQANWRHEGFSKGVAQWIQRHNQYSTDEVALIQRLRGERMNWGHLVSTDPIRRRRAFKRLGAKLPFRPLVRFLYTYVLRRGFLDGVPGLHYCLLRVAHDLHITVKLRETRQGRGTAGENNA